MNTVMQHFTLLCESFVRPKSTNPGRFGAYLLVFHIFCVFTEDVHHPSCLLIILAELVTYSCLFCCVCHLALSGLTDRASHLQKEFHHQWVWRQRGAACVWDWEFWSLKEIKAVGRTDSMAQERKKGGVLPPDGGWGWMIVAGCFVVTVCTRAVTR